MNFTKFTWISLFLLVALFSSAQVHTGSFKVIPLGVKGGLDESNLSAYLVAAKDSEQFICLDAGSLHAGIQKAIDHKLFKEQDANWLQQNKINSYFISHGHLDHTAGLILNAPNDSKKNIYALASVIDVFKSSLFSTKSWSNFGNEGDLPIIGKYHYTYLQPKKEIEVPSTGLFVTPFVLSHIKPYESTAFLVRHQNNYLLYLGDTGPDAIEQSNQLEQLWKQIAGLVIHQQLKAIFIEVSFPNKVPDKSLFGHLTPNWLMKEMEVLNTYAHGQLNNTPIYITHIKPCPNCTASIQNEIEAANTLGLKIRFAEQAKPIELP